RKSRCSLACPPPDSKETLRVDVHLHAHGTAWLWPLRKHLADEALKVRTPCPVDQQAETIAARHQCQWRLCRTKHRYGRILGRCPPQGPRVAFRLGSRRGTDDDPRKPAEGRHACTLPLGYFPRIEAFGIAGNDRLHHRMVRLVGLQQTEAFPARSAGAPGDLR